MGSTVLRVSAYKKIFYNKHCRANGDGTVCNIKSCKMMCSDEKIEEIHNIIHAESVDEIPHCSRKNKAIRKTVPEICISRLPDKVEKPEASDDGKNEKQRRSDVIRSRSKHTECSTRISHISQVKKLWNDWNRFSQRKFLLNNSLRDLIADNDRSDHYTHFKKSIHSPLAVYVVLCIDLILFNLTKQCFFRNVRLQCRLIDFSTVLSQGPYNKLFFEKVFGDLKVHDHFF